MGVYLSEPDKQKHIEEGRNQKMAFICAEMQGWRKSMEDAAIHELNIGDGNSLFAVFDGHGGSQISKYVSKNFVNTLIKTNHYKNKDYKQALDEAFMLTDRLIQSEEGQTELHRIRYGDNPPSNVVKEFIGASVGCTANVILITPKSYFIANAGDSRSVLCKGTTAVALSEDHKPDSPQQQARIKKAGGTIQMGRVNGGLNLSRSFADFDYKRVKQLSYAQQMITCKPDVKEIERSEEDEFILLGCDGIWQRYVQNNQGLIDIVRQKMRTYKKNLRNIVQDLLERLIATDTVSGIGCDNMTALIILLK